MKTNNNQTQKSEYDIQAENFLKETNTEFKAEFLRHDFYFPSDKTKRDIYEITLKRGERVYKFTFGQSIAASVMGWIYTKEGQKPSNDLKELKKYRLGEKQININYETPSPYSVLSCLTKCDYGTFESFCLYFGYDTDSREAERIYKAVLNEYQNIQILYNEEEINKLREIQ